MRHGGRRIGEHGHRTRDGVDGQGARSRQPQQAHGSAPVRGSGRRRIETADGRARSVRVAAAGLRIGDDLLRLLAIAQRPGRDGGEVPRRGAPGLPQHRRTPGRRSAVRGRIRRGLGLAGAGAAGAGSARRGPARGRGRGSRRRAGARQAPGPHGRHPRPRPDRRLARGSEADSLHFGKAVDLVDSGAARLGSDRQDRSEQPDRGEQSRQRPDDVGLLPIEDGPDRREPAAIPQRRSPSRSRPSPRR